MRRGGARKKSGSDKKTQPTQPTHSGFGHHCVFEMSAGCPCFEPLHDASSQFIHRPPPPIHAQARLAAMGRPASPHPPVRPPTTTTRTSIPLFVGGYGCQQQQHQQHYQPAAASAAFLVGPFLLHHNRRRRRRQRQQRQHRPHEEEEGEQGLLLVRADRGIRAGVWPRSFIDCRARHTITHTAIECPTITGSLGAHQDQDQDDNDHHGARTNHQQHRAPGKNTASAPTTTSITPRRRPRLAPAAAGGQAPGGRAAALLVPSRPPGPLPRHGLRRAPHAARGAGGVHSPPVHPDHRGG